MRYYIIAGEASGDLHGSNLIKGLLGQDPDAQIRFWGGDLMSKALAEGGHPEQATPVRHYKEGAVMGITDVLAKAGKLLRNVKDCKEDILRWKPDVVVLIDYPGFNFKIAEFAHKQGFKVYYYIAPKTWASREGRNRKLKSFVDRLFIVFPFEIPYFSQREIPFIYKGNPLVDAVDFSPAMSQSKEDFVKAHGLNDGRFIAILPGSRKGEISRTLPMAAQMAREMHEDPRYNDVTFLVAGAPSRTEQEYAALTEGLGYMKVIFGDTYGILRHSEAAVINSGTASLEAALIGTPQVVVWSTTPLTAFIGKHVLKVLDHIKYISLGNLIVDRLVFRELIQDEMTPEKVGAEIRRLIEDEPYRNAMIHGYADIRESLGGTGASQAVAKAMIEELQKN